MAPGREGRANAKGGSAAAAKVKGGPADGEVVGRACPICQTQIIRGEMFVACPACALGYHEECWRENEGCGAYGCKLAPETIKEKADPAAAIRWEGDKRCPACSRTIKAQALVCQHCREEFWTRDPISKQQWADREYKEHELGKVRNAVVATFIASACGCLWPFAALFTGLWIFNNSGPYPMTRMPENLRLLLKASFGAACVWGVVFMLVMIASAF